MQDKIFWETAELQGFITVLLLALCIAVSWIHHTLCTGRNGPYRAGWALWFLVCTGAWGCPRRYRSARSSHAPVPSPPSLPSSSSFSRAQHTQPVMRVANVSLRPPAHPHGLTSDSAEDSRLRTLQDPVLSGFFLSGVLASEAGPAWRALRICLLNQVLITAG